MTLEPLKEFDLPDSVIGSYWKDITIHVQEKAMIGKESLTRGGIDFENYVNFWPKKRNSWWRSTHRTQIHQ